MPIGVPRIIYCWGEELPAQWTDIYNFIFRRRMVFLMQYLDDELCNQICGLLINIHMEDRSKELEKKEIERSGVFKSSTKPTTALSSQERGIEGSSNLAGADSYGIGDRTGTKQNASFYNKKSRSMEDLLNADEDLGIDDIDTLEQFTLQKITTEWLNWNAQFFDYSDEPYLFYLAELLSKDFNKAQNSQKFNEKNPLYLLSRSYSNQSQEDRSLSARSLAVNPQTSLSTEVDSATSSPHGERKEAERMEASPPSLSSKILHSQLLNMLKNKKEGSPSQDAAIDGQGKGVSPNPEGASMAGPMSPVPFGQRSRPTIAGHRGTNSINSLTYLTNKAKIQMGEVYSPFRTNANFSNTLGFKITTNAVFKDLFPHGVASPGPRSPGPTSPGPAIEGQRGVDTLKTKKQKLLQMFQQYKNFSGASFSNSLLSSLTPLKENATALFPVGEREQGFEQHKKINNLLAILAQKSFSSKLTSPPRNRVIEPLPSEDRGGILSAAPASEGLHGANSVSSATQYFSESSEKILGQRNLRREYNLERNFSSSLLGSEASSPNSVENKRFTKGSASKGKMRFGGKAPLPPYHGLKSFNYLSPFASSFGEGSRGVEGGGLLKPGSLSASGSGAVNSQSEFRDYYRKQTERALIEEESKKVFVIINSFGGSVGNGVTVHDALQFIKAGSLTLALGVAASAASLALAGGTIGERYVTEGCHVMIHQPESSLQGQASDIWIDSQEIMKIRLDVAEIYSLSTYRPRHKILRDLDRDFYLTATETIQYGLADEIATNEVMMTIMEEVNRAWDYHDSKQQRLLETRESASSGLDTQTQN